MSNESLVTTARWYASQGGYADASMLPGCTQIPWCQDMTGMSTARSGSLPLLPSFKCELLSPPSQLDSG